MVHEYIRVTLIDATQIHVHRNIGSEKATQRTKKMSVSLRCLPHVSLNHDYLAGNKVSSYIHTQCPPKVLALLSPPPEPLPQSRPLRFPESQLLWNANINTESSWSLHLLRNDIAITLVRCSLSMLARAAVGLLPPTQAEQPPFQHLVESLSRLPQSIMWQVRLFSVA